MSANNAATPPLLGRARPVVRHTAAIAPPQRRGSSGTPLHPDTITALFHRHCEGAGLPRIRLHDVRHSYATAALEAGISPQIISEQLGHATAAFTVQTYTHGIPGMDESAASTVADLILGSAPTGGRKSGRNSVGNALEMQSAPGNPGADVGSGGRT